MHMDLSMTREPQVDGLGKNMRNLLKVSKCQKISTYPEGCASQRIFHFQIPYNIFDYSYEYIRKRLEES
jgi:hypothetical protein